jgi:ubiquinone/menaquinone biosynthesis C-methylase UbiE
MAWDLFERAASRYENWYTTAQGTRADRAERALLTSLLGFFPQIQTVLEVGCGTGHFTRWLTSQGLHAIGLDRAPAMLSQLRMQDPTLPVILGDAHGLPVRNRAVDAIILITTLEFLEQPGVALTEAIRVARCGLILLVLNRWSLGGLSRRWGKQAGSPLLGNAHDYSIGTLRAMVQSAAGRRLQSIHLASTLFPNGLWSLQTKLPFGDIIAVTALLT